MPVKKYAAALAIVGLAGYLFISGAEVAAQRSFIMLAVMLTAVLFDRAALTLRNLAISAIVVIALSPHEVVGPSFQMSFAATAALVGAYAAWSDWRADHPGQPPANRSLPRRAVRYMLLAAGGPRRDLDRRRRRDRHLRRLAFPADAVARPFHQSDSDADRLGGRHALRGARRACHAVRPRRPVLRRHGLGLSATIAIARWFSERSPADIVGLVPPASVAVLTVALLIATVSSTWLRARCCAGRAGRPALARRSPAARPLRLRGRPPCRARSATGASPSTAHGRTNSPSTTGNAPCARTMIVRPEGKQERTSSSD